MLFINKKNKASRGHVLIIILNVMILLSIALFSFSFNTFMENKFAQKIKKRQQARFNAESGIDIARLKLLKKDIQEIPFVQTFPLHGDRESTAYVSIDYVSFKRVKEFLKLEQIIKSRYIRIRSIGSCQEIRHTVVAVFNVRGTIYKELFRYNSGESAMYSQASPATVGSVPVHLTSLNGETSGASSGQYSCPSLTQPQSRSSSSFTR